MAYISFQPKDYFNTTLYTGTALSNAITGVGFQPDMTWLKSRGVTAYHYVFDSARGATKAIFPNDTDEEATNAEYLKSWESDGFTLGTNTGANGSTNTYVSWNWKAGTATGIDTTGSTITPSAYTFNQTAGFSAIAYTGNSTAGATLPHGLGVRPDFVAVKRLDTAGSQWACPFTAMESDFDWVLHWETQSGYSDAVTWFNDTAPTAVNLVLGTNSAVNTAHDYIAYCWARKKGYSDFGVYTGTGNIDGPFINTGFRPAFVMIKRVGTTGSWSMYDNKRLGYNGGNSFLEANATDADDSADQIDLLSNGFKIRNTGTYTNASATPSYVYAAFAEFPFVSSNSKATVAR